jgi:uncharacterized membrane protein YebE (DUF533 family)
MKGSVYKIVALGLLALNGVAFAQSNETPVLDKREKRQEARIEQGKESGQLNDKEAARLENREAKLKADEAAAKSDGKVTAKERKKLNKEANRDSKRIAKQKHDRQKE